MFQHGRQAFALLALSLAASAFAADPLPANLAALQTKAENGNAIAQYNLGLAYANGRGVPWDPIEAYVWLTLASEQGSTAKELGVITSAMSDETLAQAKLRLSQVRSNLGISDSCPEDAGLCEGKGVRPLSYPSRNRPPGVPRRSTAAPASETEPLKAKIKELQNEVSQRSSMNEQLSQQLDERGQALIQALAQISATKSLQETQYNARVAELAATRKALEAAKTSLDNSEQQSSARIEALQTELAKRSTEANSLSDRLAKNEDALKGTSDAGRKDTGASR